MADYGVTPTGLNIKRLDTIMDEIHADLTSGWGVNTRLNPKSLLNVMVTDFSDKLAELWEFGAGIYWSMYPSTAEGSNLDNAAQFGGVLREGEAPSYYPTHCKGVDGTLLYGGTTMIKSSTDPVQNFIAVNDAYIAVGNCTEAMIKVSGTPAQGDYTITVKDTTYKYTADNTPTTSEILSGLQAVIAADSNATITAEIDADTGYLKITNNEPDNNTALTLSTNLTTEYVVSIIMFASENTGDIVQPNNTITEIVTAVTGLQAVWNQSAYVKGRKRETDVEFRKSYIDKIFGMSSRMTESISSAILKLDGVESAATFENLTDYYNLSYKFTGATGTTGTGPYCFQIDGIWVVFTLTANPGVGDVVTYYTGERGKINYKHGSNTPTQITVTLSTADSAPATELTFDADMYPHSVESIVYGGSDTEIAQTIFDTKAGGINTFGNDSATALDEFNNEVTVRFSRPSNVYVFFRVTVVPTNSTDYPQNGNELIQNIILSKMALLRPGEYVRPQEWMTDIYSTVSGIAYMTILLYSSTDPDASPSAEDYTEYAVDISRREIAVTDLSKVTVTQ